MGQGDRAAPMLMIVTLPGGMFALAVDAVTDTQELVVKPVAPAVMAAGTVIPRSARIAAMSRSSVRSCVTAGSR